MVDLGQSDSEEGFAAAAIANLAGAGYSDFRRLTASDCIPCPAAA
jgi:hypothetical protein